MKKITMALLVLVLFGCGDRTTSVTAKDGTNGRDGRDGSSCSVSNILEGESLIGALISCTDGSWSQIFNGSAGAQGAQGVAGDSGANGTSCSVQRGCEDNFVTVTCGETSSVIYDGESGPRGSEGPTGPEGSAGSNGDSPTCTTSLVATTFTFQDWSILPVILVPAVADQSAYCSKHGQANHPTTATNCNQWNSVHSSGWIYHAAVPASPAVMTRGEFELRAVVINIPTVTCSTPSPTPEPN